MSNDRRSSFRCPVSDDFAVGVLRVGSGEYKVCVVEQSAGGFGVQSDHPISVSAGQTAMLKTPQGIFEVLVVHNSRADKGHRIGLQRLAESSSPENRRVHARASAPRSRFPVGVLAMCVAFFGSGVAVPMLVESDADARKIASSEAQNGRLSKSVLLLNELKSTRFMEDLRLELPQQEKIQSAVDDAVFNLNALFQNRERMTDEERASVGFQLLTSAWQEIQATLTDEQRTRWNEMLRGGDDRPTKS